MSKEDMSCRPASLKFTIDNILNLKQNSKESDAHYPKQAIEVGAKNDFQRRLEDHGVQNRQETDYLLHGTGKVAYLIRIAILIP